MRKDNLKVILLASLVANMLLLPLNYLSLKIPTARLGIYEALASKIMGNPEIVFTGDSITSGGGIWAFRINRYNLRTVNLAVGGASTEDVKLYTLRAIEKTPNLKRIFVMSGRNDMPTNYKKGNAQLSISEYKQILSAALKKGISIYVTSTLYRADEQYPEIVDELNAFLKQYCIENGQMYIDLNAELSSNGKLRQEFTKDGDGSHINEKAYDIWAGMIRSALTHNETL